MITGPLTADIAGLVGEPARATMLTALLDGRALTATELAYAARVTDVETRELFVSDVMPHFA
jgi:uridine phosphorylase